MTESRKPTAQDSLDIEDDAPDLAESPWAEKLAATPVLRGRPKSDQTKISTTIRLDADILERFRAGGPGWQSRINEALRDWLTKR
ncbi:BrnA antitoxin family protein [Neorhizobium sp. S3-V5DH]|uniref:BrnA antitoxin family protein n=1 Tax=Neorhizobium sp. S3-V5DH TaxID=2485166 RepID=UPI00104B1876|nr:BrnA antitoxin family protein [Neorhizobium sp. S3-V5DH]TCV71380.1 BrnA antitoxin of type II toxin-antitoxin system [Neorhizobium sp. S3-V5DH]